MPSRKPQVMKSNTLLFGGGFRLFVGFFCLGAAADGSIAAAIIAVGLMISNSMVEVRETKKVAK